ncbi:MAG: DUF58 domain-containing protein [Candidatus Dormibacteraeota bacterium]|nr:DUF58 domain-containing protein [Candidatus Dormibacteraeota bacterium]
MPPDPRIGLSVEELLRRSRWPVLRRLGIHPGGDERSRLRGPGMEYSDVREYQPGDDPRSIEWTITARSDRPYVRESFPDRGLDAWLLVDVTRSLDWGTARVLKRQLAVEVAVLAGQLLSGRGNRVGALLFGPIAHTVVRPAAGRTALMQLITRVEHAGAASASGDTDLGRALTEAGRLIRRPSLLILISDFLTPDGWQKPLSSLGLRHEIISIWIADPRESDIPDIGVVTFEDPENGKQLLVDTSNKRLRARFQEAAATQRRRIKDDLIKARSAVAEFSTGSEVVPQLVQFLKERQAQRGHRTAVAAR